jgi:hypothetical protein
LASAGDILLDENGYATLNDGMEPAHIFSFVYGSRPTLWLSGLFGRNTHTAGNL